MNLFEQATRQKLRFQTAKGSLSVEALWDLPLQSKANVSLDQLAIGISREVKAQAEESFVSTPTVGSTELTLKLDILKHIIQTRLDENQKAIEASETRSKRGELLELIHAKKKQALIDTPLEELEAKLATLN